MRNFTRADLLDHWTVLKTDRLASFALKRRRDRHPPPAQARSAGGRTLLPEALERQGRAPRRLVTDKLRSYSAAHGIVMPCVVHSTQQYENNRAEVSRQPTRQRERQMRRFKSTAHAQRFLSVHCLVRNLFRVGRISLLTLSKPWYTRVLSTKALPPQTGGDRCVSRVSGASVGPRAWLEASGDRIR